MSKINLGIFVMDWKPPESIVQKCIEKKLEYVNLVKNSAKNLYFWILIAILLKSIRSTLMNF